MYGKRDRYLPQIFISLKTSSHPATYQKYKPLLKYLYKVMFMRVQIVLT
jgi:hypothetical protein